MDLDQEAFTHNSWRYLRRLDVSRLQITPDLTALPFANQIHPGALPSPTDNGGVVQIVSKSLTSSCVDLVVMFTRSSAR